MNDVYLVGSDFLKFKYNNLYRFNSLCVTAISALLAFKYNNLYRLNEDEKVDKIEPIGFKYNNLYRFNLMTHFMF